MILGKFWTAFRAQLNKIANVFWEADPIAQMQYEYDSAVEQMKEGRQGLETYRALVERVTRQVAGGRDHVRKLEAETKAYLKAGQRDAAAKCALELQKAKGDLAANEQQFKTIQELSAKHPDDVNLHLIIADRFLEMKMYAPARDEYFQVLRLDPKNKKVPRQFMAAAATEIRLGLY